VFHPRSLRRNFKLTHYPSGAQFASENLDL
jgi:hypothetical protein